MGPGIALGELLEEHGRGPDAAETVAAGIGQVGRNAGQIAQVLVKEGHVPDALAAGLAGGLQPGEQVVLGAKGTGGHAPPQGDDAGPGQGGQVDDGLGLKASGIGQGIGQDQASLGIGVDDLDGLAVHGGDDVAGLVSTATGQVLGSGHEAHHVQGQFELADGEHGPQDGGAAAHIAAHAVHLLGRLEGDAARVEGDPLADEDNGIEIVPARVVLHDNKGGRLVTAPGDPQEGAHLEFCCILLVQDLAAHVVELAGNFEGQFGQIGGRGIVGRPVDEIAGQAGSLGGDLAHPSPCLDGGQLCLIKLDKGEPLRVGAVRGLVLELLVAVQSQDSALYDSLSGFLQVKTTGSGSVDDAAEGLDPQIAGLDGGCSGGFAHPLQGELVLGPKADEDNARGGNGAPWIKDGGLALLAAEITIGNDFADGAAQGLVDGAGGAAGLLDAFKKVDNNQFIFG